MGIDVLAGSARSRGWDNHNYQLWDNVSWARGKHNIQLGAGWQRIQAFHQRDDKIVGAQLTALVYNLAARTALSIPAAAFRRTLTVHSLRFRAEPHERDS